MKAVYLILIAVGGVGLALVHLYSCNKNGSTKKFEIQAIPEIMLNTSGVVYGGAFAFSPFFPELSKGLTDPDLFILISGLVVAVVSGLNLRKYWQVHESAL